MDKTKAKILIIAGFALFTGFVPVFGAPALTPPSQDGEIAAIQSSSLLPIASPQSPEKVLGRMDVVLTAYSSTPGQTDSTPFITASGTYVKSGIVATNVLPFGTRIRIPSVYGDRIFTVEDRMAERKHYQVDIWFPNYTQAKDFGAKYAQIEILGS